MPSKQIPTAKAPPVKKPPKKVEKRSYEAPALEKGLDVLELLAGLSRGVNQSEIAQLLGRSLQEVYRVVMVLERRGYIQRHTGEDGFYLSNRVFDLAHRYPPLARLVDLATPIMNAASVAADQAMHIAILDKTDIRVVAQVDSPAPSDFDCALVRRIRRWPPRREDCWWRFSRRRPRRGSLTSCARTSRLKMPRR
ncbi:helix-turn-helix domain-containing protein [Hoeflea sp. G2-23]|uniref:Helix-turn-helix domain-containing protein n=1 Tax=Hoeflea algicola TaxID=2983763 RepID=A0ABT3ZA25_9HYPH|nr:helix-turn-helix domain-containing protein [Hoeflea algicola]MCY0148630.1 helix-turn-helix domain-containing protein [Hoeflea algicola]